MRNRMLPHENTRKRKELERVFREGMVAGNGGKMVEDEGNPYFCADVYQSSWFVFRRELTWMVGQSHGYDLHKAGITITNEGTV